MLQNKKDEIGIELARHNQWLIERTTVFLPFSMPTTCQERECVYKELIHYHQSKRINKLKLPTSPQQCNMVIEDLLSFPSLISSNEDSWRLK